MTSYDKFRSRLNRAERRAALSCRPGLRAAVRECVCAAVAEWQHGDYRQAEQCARDALRLSRRAR